MKLISPLRYPGGKAALADFLSYVLELNELQGCDYYEPYAGGAGAALRLLDVGLVEAIHLNDADVRIHAFWASVLHETDRFASAIEKIDLDVTEWRHQREICQAPGNYSRFEVGFSAFYLNRCNRSGVLLGAGPIGGYEQKGHWRMGVRFNRSGLVERILGLAKFKDRIHLSNLDAMDFLRAKLPRGNARKRVLVYLDPPYVGKGGRLYMNSYRAKDHVLLSKYLLAQKALPWVMSYDDDPLIRELYESLQLRHLPIRYSLQAKRKASELLISPLHIRLPANLQELVNETPLKRLS